MLTLRIAGVVPSGVRKNTTEDYRMTSRYKVNKLNCESNQLSLNILKIC